MKVAVIGGGIAGNTAAYELAKKHEVTLFEANAYLGGHTHTHDIEVQGQQYAIDTGFIVFNERTYPQFNRLLQTLGVAKIPTEMSFSVSCVASGLEYNGHSLNTLFAQRKNLFSVRFFKMVKDILRFNQNAPKALETLDANISLGEYLTTEHYSATFISHYIIPMGAAIWSTDLDKMRQFPAHFFIRFFLNHGLLSVRNRPQWFVIKGGSKQYLPRLSEAYNNTIRLNTPVISVQRFADRVEISTQQYGVERFDSVFIAAHSDQALVLLKDPSAEEHRVLSKIPYQANSAVLHTDASVMPKQKRAWAAWNYRLQPGQEKATLTYYMNRLQSLSCASDFFVTLNDDNAVNPDTILRRIQYHHPLFTTEGMEAQSQKTKISGVNRTYYCGAYWGNGFHEDGVASAMQAVEQFTRSEQI